MTLFTSLALIAIIFWLCFVIGSKGVYQIPILLTVFGSMALWFKCMSWLQDSGWLNGWTIFPVILLTYAFGGGVSLPIIKYFAKKMD